MQTQFATSRPADGGFPPLRVCDQGAAFDSLRERAAVGLPLASPLWLEAVQLPVVPGERRDAHQSLIVRGRAPSYRAVGQHPRIDAVRSPDLCQLLPRLLESQLFSEFFCLITLLGLDRSQLAISS